MFSNFNNSANKIVEFQSNYTLPPSLASGLGCNAITINSGTYNAVFEPTNPYGHIIVNVTSN